MADERPGGPPATPAIGAVPLPPGYVLVEKLGSGGFATVWLAEQGRLGRRVAVKLLGETLSDSERERRFIAECRAIGRLSGHPAVVTVHDAGTTDAGHPYLVMEHLPGGSLHDRMHREGPLPWVDVLDVGVTVADALAAAHAAGILHRDVKPANVLLGADGSPKLGDFGIARLSEGTNTVTGTLVGTIPFTPPEVLSGHRPGPTADVWALGATLHTLLTAKSTFGGHRDEPPAATIARVLRSEPPPLGPEVPAALRDLIAEMLRPEPRDRPDGADAVVSRLQAIQADRGLPVTPAQSTRRATPTAPLGDADATVVGLGAAVVATPPPPPPGPAAPPPPLPPASPSTDDVPTDDVPWGDPTPPPFPRTGDQIGREPAGSDHGFAEEGDDPSAATAVGPSVGPAVGPALAKRDAAAAPTPPGTGDEIGREADRSDHGFAEAGATSVLPVVGGSGAGHGHPGEGRDAGGSGAAPPPPPPPPPPGRGRSASRDERKAKAPVLVGLAVLVALVLVAGVVLALVGGGGEDDADGSGTTATETTAGPDAVPTAVDTPLGAPLAVPAGLAAEPASGTAWDIEAPCTDAGACSIVADDGGVVAVRAPGDGTATVEQLAADTGEAEWSRPIEGLEGRPGLARLGGLVVVSSTAGETRTYRGIDEGELRWEVEIPQDDGPVFPNTQLSEDYGVLLLGNVGAYLVVDLQTGDTQRGEGRVLATDRVNVYVADGDRVVARALATGDERWVADGVVSAAPPAGVFPAWRYGTIAGGILVTATADQVVGINPESGGEQWPGVAISADGADLGRPIAVSNVGDVVVVAAERGDLGVRAATGELLWREPRDRLVYDPELDPEAIEEAEGTPVWVGAGDHLLVGWTGAHLQLLDVTTGEVLGAVDLEPTGGRSAVAIGADAIAILQAGGTIAAYGYDTLDGPLWTSDAHPEATGLAAVDGGLVVVDPTGLHALRS